MTMPEPHYRTQFALAAGALSLLAFIAGCHVGPPYRAPAPPAVTAPNYKESTVNFHDADGWKVASPQDAMIRGNWWELFREPELNALEDSSTLTTRTSRSRSRNTWKPAP
jgi:outer membrane protein TolC